jgi:hypothetical protein
MAPKMTADRRAEPRSAPPRDIVAATLRPGCSVNLVNVSPWGALVQSSRQLRPGATVHLLVSATFQRLVIGAAVLRCYVDGVSARGGMTYRGALLFESRVEWRCD